MIEENQKAPYSDSEILLLIPDRGDCSDVPFYETPQRNLINLQNILKFIF